MVPQPIRVGTTGTPVISANSINRSDASALMMPPPATISAGVVTQANSAAAAMQENARRMEATLANVREALIDLRRRFDGRTDPDALSRLELVLAETERRRGLIPLPFGVARIIGGLCQPLALLTIAPPITADQVELLKQDNVANPALPGLADLGVTTIYVTHDQTEALTFADQVVVMSRGKAVQVGAADALFERPAHTFVGHFIGSPGMNFLPGQWRDGAIEVAGRRYMPDLPPATQATLQAAGSFRIGVRPEYLQLAPADDPQAMPVRVARAQDIGTYWLMTATVDHGQDATLRARLGTEAAALRPGDTAWLTVFNRHTCFYINEELVS